MSLLKLFTLFAIVYPVSLHAEQYTFVDAEICPLVCPSSQVGRGFLVDIMQDALAEHGHELSLLIAPYQRALHMVRHGEADGLPTVYREDAPDLLYGRSLFYRGENKLFVMDDFPRPPDSITPWEGLKIAVIDGYTFGNEALDNYLKEQKKADKPKVLFISGEGPYQRMLWMLELGRIDAIIDDRAFILYALKQLNDSRPATDQIDVKALAHISYGANIIAYSPRNPQQSAYLMTIFDNYIEKLHETGRFQDYVTPYGL